MKMLAKRIRFHKRKYRLIRFSSSECLVCKLKAYKSRKKKQHHSIHVRYMITKFRKHLEENKDELFSN